MGNGQIALDMGMLLAVLGFIVTVMTFVWRMATLVAKVQRNEDKHDKMEDSLKRAHLRLDEYSKKHDSSLEEMRRRLRSSLTGRTGAGTNPVISVRPDGWAL